MTETNRLRREPSNRSARWLAALASAAMLSLLSARAFAFAQPLCNGISCTGGSPILNIANGGLHHAEIVPILWGSTWTAAQQAQVAGMVQQVVNGAYLGGLGQYGGNGIEVGPARMVPTVPIRSGTPVAHCSNGAACPSGSCASGPTCGTTDIVNTINATINAGLVPPPAANQLTDILYVVFVPTTFTPFALNTTGTWNGRTYKVAWINGLSGKGFTHELVEAITQNVTVTNCVDTNNPSNAVNQIVDPCGCWFPNQGGVEMAAYWSAIHSACVVADGWAGVWRFNNSPGNWTQISTDLVRQVYAGGFGVVATNTTDNLQLFSPPSTWTTISGPGSMFAVGTTTIVRLSPLADSVAVFNGTPNSWTTIHGSRSAVYAGSRIVTTDFAGTEFSWLNSGDNWANIGKAGDQIVVTGTGRVYGIALDHNSVWMTPNNSGVWSQVGAPSSELFGGISANPAGTPVASPRDIWMYQGTGQNWLRQNGPGVMFAVAGSAGDLFMLDSTRSTIQQSTNTHQTNPQWIQVGASGFGRLVGSGNQLFAVGEARF